MTTSLRKRLVFITLSSLVGVWSLMAIWVYVSSKHEVEEVYDATLAQNAKLLLNLVHHEMEEGEGHFVHIAQLLPVAHEYEAKMTFAIHHPEGSLALRAPNAPEFPLHPIETGYRDVTVGNERWRVFSLIAPESGVIVQAGQRYQVRDEMVAFLSSSILPVIALSLLLIALAVWFSIGKGLAPLLRVAASISRREPGRLAPVEEAGVPLEIRPLVSELNRLLARLESAFELERRFTADATHELRTPLSAIRTQAQVALRASDEVQRRRALEQIIIGMDRTSHLLSQMLTLARVDAQDAAAWTVVDLYQLCADVILEHQDRAYAKDIHVALEGDRVSVSGDAGLIHVLVSNLLNNAIRYVPKGGRVVVSLGAVREGIELMVRDDGPGIPSHQRQHMFERFRRGDAPKEAGSGLGLSIVKRVVEIHDAAIRLGDGLDGQGLGVSVIFKIPQA